MFAAVASPSTLPFSIAVALLARIALLVLLYFDFGCETTLEKSPSLRKGFVAGAGGAAASVEATGAVWGE